MKSILMIKNIEVENANAISGLTYGFPSMTQFLGFTHALSRKLDSPGLSFKGCAVVSHSHQIHTHHPKGYFGDLVFSLTRNPLTKNAGTPSFNEEGRMHMRISLLIECDFTREDLEVFEGEDSDADVERFTSHIRDLVYRNKLCGGTIVKFEEIKFKQLPENSKAFVEFKREILIPLLPGFFLVDRSSYLEDHVKNHHKDNIFEAWLDFYSLKDKAEFTESKDPEWYILPKPYKGWLVPVMTGYKGISALYPPGGVKNARDPSVPFRFVEPIYGIGEWLSPHRVKKIEEIFWNYEFKDDFYLTKTKDNKNE